MLIPENLPKYLLPDAAKHAAYTKNRPPHNALNMGTPIKRWNPKINIEERKFLRAFGKDVCVHLPEKDIRNKFTARAIEGQIIEYAETPGIYKVYCKDRKIRITKNPKSRITSSPNQSGGEIEVPQVLDKVTEPISHNYTILGNEIYSEGELKTPPVSETPTTERRRKTPNDWMQIVGSRKSTRSTKKPEKYTDAKITLRS
jgi:hypothetical protein